MPGSHDSPAEHADRGSIETREVLLVAAAILALILAAFVMPPTAAGGGGQGGEQTATATATATPGGDGGGGDPGDGPGEVDDVEYRPGDGDGSPEGGVLFEGTAEPHPGCFVVVWDRLVPGKEVTVLAWNDGSVDRGRTVWFDGRPVGETNATGRVDGRVPYSRQLEVTVRQPDADECTFVALNRTTGFDEWRDDRAVDFSDAREIRTVSRVDGNVSATFDVLGEANLEVTGEPFPGETVQVHATVDDVPMRSATVTVNGRTVGETDENGNYTLRVPDDGTEELDVEVSRGDFAASETITVLQLDVDLRSGFLPFPGREAEAVATLGDRNATNATVRVGGERVGTTDLTGRTTFELPPDPTATVTVTGYGQTATAPIWPLYLRTLLVVLVGLAVVVGSVAGASREGTAGSTRLVAGAWAVVALLVAAWIVGGREVVGLLLAGAGLLGLALGTFVYRETVVEVVRSAVATCRRLVRAAASTLRAVVLGLRRLAIRLADLLLSAAEWTAAWLRSLLVRLARAPRSLPALLALLGDWLAGLVRFLRRLARRGGTLARSGLSPRRLVVLAAIAAVAGAGYAVAGPRGALVAAVAALALLGVATRRSEEPAGQDRPGGSTLAAVPAVESGEESSGRPTLRALWRAFARRVVPDCWRSSTPGEVARSAIDMGFPRGPVERLTAVFREVEYGDRSLSEERYGRARAAFRALRGSGSGEQEGGE